MKNLSSEEVSLLCKAMIVSSMEERLKKFDIDIKNLTTDKTAGKYRKFMRAYLRFICYIPAERNLAGAISSSLANIILSKTPLPNTLLEYISLFERAKNHYSTYDASFLGIKYEQDKGADCISLIGNNDKSLPLEACSSGIQSVLPMLMVMDYAREDKCFDTFIVEEPEQNLFPINQREILNRLISLTHKKDCRSVIINTHSPYILSALNVSMLAAKLSSMEQYKSDVAKIVPPQYHINSSDVSVFSLGEEPFCKSIIDKKTGLVSINDLDVLSEAIGSDFNRLYQLYLKSLQK
jgi:predicted ATPase